MSESEVVSLFNELFSSVLGAIETFMAALFAMLVTAYFAGPKLTRSMSITIVGLFTGFSALAIFMAVAASRRVAGMILEFDRFTDQGLDLSWIYVLPTTARIVPSAFAGLLIAAYCATLIFFFQSRRRALST